MKRKLLSMMTLLLCAVLGMQAQTTIYSWEGGADGATETGGTAAWVNGAGDASRLNYKNGDYYTMCLNGKKANLNDTEASNNASKMVITLDQAVAEGDEIAFTAYINKNESKKASAYILFENGAAIEGEVFSDESNIDPAFGNAPTTKITTVTAEAAGSKTITLTRSQSGTNLFITKLVITRAGGGSDEAKPAITFEAGAKERSITVGLNAAGKVSVDWGDGKPVEMEAAGAYDGWDNSLEFTGTPAGTVKVYGEGIIYFQSFTKYDTDATTISGGITSIDLSGVAATLTELDIHQNNLKSVDLSALTALTSLNIGVNDFTTIDLSALTALTKLDISNGKNNGVLTALDLSKNTKLTNIVASGNQLTTLDLSSNPVAKTVTVLNNQLTSVIFGANTATKHTINVGGNKLTSLDLMQFADCSGTYLRARDNDLTEVKLPAKVSQFWADGNAFTLAQLYDLKSMAKTLTYATTFTKAEAQAPLTIAADGGKVDLSAQAKLGETATVFTWKAADGTALAEGTDYTVADGVFTFLKSQTGIYCEMTNAELNAFTAEKPYKTTAVDVVATGISTAKVEGAKAMIFNLAGQRLDAPAKGLNIIGGKKVMVK